MHKVHAGYTLLLRLRSGQFDAVKSWLATAKIPFGNSKTTHFATITVLPRQSYRNEILPATLLFATSYWGPDDDHVRDLLAATGPELCELFAFCEGFDPASLELFVTENRHSDCFYSGMHHVSREDVVRDATLRDAIEAYIDDHQLPSDPIAAREQIQSYVATQPDLEWALEPDRLDPIETWFAMHRRGVRIAGITIAAFLATWGIAQWSFLVAVLAWLVVVGFVALMLWNVRRAEEEQTYVSIRQPDDVVAKLAATQLRPVINEFVIAGPIKEEGAMRPQFLRLALYLVEWLVEGALWRTAMHIPTVATARWIPADGGKRLVFISNYTNAADAYVRDFIDTTDGARNINLSFGFGRGYPKTTWIMGSGALDNPNAFSYVVSEHQSAAAYWFGPYASLSVDNIKINRQIREGLVGDKNHHEAKSWLHLL